MKLRSNGQQGSLIAGDDVVELSPNGRAIYDKLIAACSAVAGCEVSIDEIIQIRNAIRDDFGTDQLDFADPKISERFYAYLRGDVKCAGCE